MKHNKVAFVRMLGNSHRMIDDPVLMNGYWKTGNLMIKGLFNLEKVSKRPVSQHLKEGVMVGILSNIIQVIVLPSSSNGPLRVGLFTRVYCTGLNCGRVRGRRRERKGGKEGRKKEKEEKQKKKKKCRLLRDQLKAGPKIGNCSNGEQGSG